MVSILTDESAFGALAVYWLFTRELLMLSAAGIIISSLDDLFVDLAYVVRRVWRSATVYRRYPRARANMLENAEQWPGRMAVFVPAWQESEVIGPMLRNFLKCSLYGNYRIFVGVYPNDLATNAAVAALYDPRLDIVVVDHPGPTTKADCLNAIWFAMLRHEAATGRRFKAIVLHDAEDVVHSRELVVFDHLIPAKAMVQLPVVPIPDRRSRWIAGHYLDEFAESHGKDIVVREALGAAVPSAGVACAFERAMLGCIADSLGGAPFDPDSLTEDYELGLRVAARGGKAALVRMASSEGGGVVATREHFPATLECDESIIHEKEDGGILRDVKGLSGTKRAEMSHFYRRKSEASFSHFNDSLHECAHQNGRLNVGETTVFCGFTPSLDSRLPRACKCDNFHVNSSTCST